MKYPPNQTNEFKVYIHSLHGKDNHPLFMLFVKFYHPIFAWADPHDVAEKPGDSLLAHQESAVKDGYVLMLRDVMKMREDVCRDAT